MAMATPPTAPQAPRATPRRSAATAALGLAGYALDSFGVTASTARIGLAVLAVGCITALVIGGMTRSNRVNGAIVTFTLLALARSRAMGFGDVKLSVVLGLGN